jgi:Na+-transporting methylmalonyl-CoA/oxaloacetate decarboxylase gamma subunit
MFTPKPEEIVSVVVILLMFLAVIVMVKKVDRAHEPQPILSPNASESAAKNHNLDQHSG